MTRIGLVARCDDGGLGTMTAEFYRHMRPEYTIVLNLEHAGRGNCHHDRYEPKLGQTVVWTNGGCPGCASLTSEAVWRMLRRVDVVYTAETTYGPELLQLAKVAGVPVVLHAMPELYDYRWPDRPEFVWVPTDWHRAEMPADTVEVPVPVALDRFEPRMRRRARTFLHLTSPAMEDRNGTQIVLNALPRLQQPCRVVITGEPRRTPPLPSHVELEWRPEPVFNYWEQYTDDIDVMLLPRRYAGLSLPVQEAAACGIPTVMSDVSPNEGYTQLRVPISPHTGTRAAMKGGYFDVHDVFSGDLAAEMDSLICSPKRVYAASVRALGWARAHSWERALPQYQRLFEVAAERKGRATEATG